MFKTQTQMKKGGGNWPRTRSWALRPTLDTLGAALNCVSLSFWHRGKLVSPDVD